ncbi:MAG: radical SAM protein [Proteobacteria bacterium]|nr:radical SAM protein [Pseudomonadota bacterium]MBU4421190.1 radical SAM protein [Pseudomonadota bacterium]MCG2829755.1 radical SAM protein [Desulfobacteraceae bacterium]
MTFGGADHLFRVFLRNYRWLIGSTIHKTPLKAILNPIKNKLNKTFPTPKAIMLAVTNKCQASCSHCGMAMYTNNGDNELSQKEIFSLSEDAANLGVRWIYYFGGEPLLRPDLLELIRYAGDLHLKTRLDTNGYLLSEEMAKNLKRSGLDKIGVSIDDIDPARHNALRGTPGIFEKATAGIRHCTENGIYCYLSTYVTKESLQNGGVRASINFARSLGVNHIRLLYAVGCGNWLNTPEIRLNKKEKQKILDLMETGFVFLEEATGSGLTHGYCSSLLKRFVYISCYGDVQPCCYLPLSFGNIRSDPLIKIIKRMWCHPMFNMDPNECMMNNELFRNQYLQILKSASELPISADLIL